MQQLPPPPVPEKLREMLKDYPEHLRRLQEALTDYVHKPFKLMPFDGATWALEGRLEAFCLEADEEVKVAEAQGEGEEEIARKKAKAKHMSRACWKQVWIGDEGLREYFSQHKDAFQ